jgi:tetratricopeptide (TPR) repeat protein
MPDVLLVEDKESLRRVLRLTLESTGYTVAEAEDARDANSAEVEFMQQGLFREAFEEFRAAASGRASAETYYNMAVIYDHLSELKKSVECYERALRLAPDFAAAHSGLGLVHSKRGEGLEAIKCCLRAISS